MTIEDRGKVESAEGYLGFDDGGIGTVVVTGSDEKGNRSTWKLSNKLYIGGSDEGKGEGHLIIEEGGLVDVQNALDVGRNGVGSLTIESGGSAKSGSSSIGVEAASKGTVTISGTGSIWNVTRDLYVGGYSGNGEGHLIVKDDGQLTTTRYLDIGRLGHGVLRVESGGKVITGDSSSIGWGQGSTGEVIVTGPGSIWELSGTLYVGAGWEKTDAEGEGYLTIADGGKVVASNVVIANRNKTTGVLAIGAQPGDPAADPGFLMVDGGTVSFGSGDGTLVFNHLDSNYEFAAAISGSGSINHLAGTTILTGDSSKFSGTTSVSGGTLTIANNLGGDVNVSQGGTVTGGGTILGNLDLENGGILYGDGQTLTINGDVTMDASSIVEVKLGNPNNTPLFDVGGEPDVERHAERGQYRLSWRLPPIRL